jgi:hypothetical protein
VEERVVGGYLSRGAEPHDQRMKHKLKDHENPNVLDTTFTYCPHGGIDSRFRKIPWK